MARGVVDTSVFIGREAGRELAALPEELAVSVVTIAELELGVLRARDAATRSQRLATLGQVRAEYRPLPIDDRVASCYARLADEARTAGRRVRQNDTWIAATALCHDAAVVTQDADFGSFDAVTVLRV